MAVRQFPRQIWQISEKLQHSGLRFPRIAKFEVSTVEVAIFVSLIAIVAAGLGIAGYFGHKAELRRTEQFAQIAGEMGFEFDPVATFAGAGAFAGLPLFSKGHSKKSKNLL